MNVETLNTMKDTLKDLSRVRTYGKSALAEKKQEVQRKKHKMAKCIINYQSNLEKYVAETKGKRSHA